MLPMPGAMASWYPASMRASIEERAKSAAVVRFAGMVEVTTLKWLIFR